MALKRIPLKAQWPRGELDYARHLEHPGLPKIYDIFLAEGCVWLPWSIWKEKRWNS